MAACSLTTSPISLHSTQQRSTYSERRFQERLVPVTVVSAVSTRATCQKKTAMGDVAVGWDSEGAAYSSTEEMWRKEAGQGEEFDAEKRGQWYQKGVEYWQTSGGISILACGMLMSCFHADVIMTTPVPHADVMLTWQGVDASYSGVLGGHERLNTRDVAESREFIRDVFGGGLEEEGGGNRVALDCGAGVGRVTENLLLDFFHEVDLAEPVSHFLDAAKNNLSSSEVPAREDGHRAVEFMCVGLQDLHPSPHRYDCIWIQWCVGHLTDADFPHFFKRAQAGLKPGGVFILKENQAREGFVFDKEDHSVTRSDQHFRKLFQECGLHVYKSKAQRGWPKELFAVHMYALTVEPREDNNSGTGVQTRSRKKVRNAPARIVD